MAAQPHPKMVSVTIKYFKPGTQPPIYIAGTFSQPEWQPEEMDYSVNGDNENEFHKDVKVEAGKEYQYKFRIGPGDWWILNEDALVGMYKYLVLIISFLSRREEDQVVLHATRDVT